MGQVMYKTESSQRGLYISCQLTTPISISGSSPIKSESSIKSEGGACNDSDVLFLSRYFLFLFCLSFIFIFFGKLLIFSLQ